MLEHFQDLQIRPQAQRLQILELLHDLMFKHRNALKELAHESIVGITDLVSGEKDPRNLMVIFSILKVVMVEWEISAHAEVCLISVDLERFTDFCLDLIRFGILLLPYHLSTTSRRPSWDYRTRPQKSSERLHCRIMSLCALRISSIT